jgi:hypothetical protein
LEENDSFVNLLKYQNTSKIIQLENYTTELFVFVLKYLKFNNSILLKNIMRKFGFYDDFNEKKLLISTQHRMVIDENDFVIPDIFIEYNNKKIIIEVKIDSNLSIKYYKRKNINQIEYYEKIGNVDRVYLLSKRILRIKNIENRILWSNIYDILNNTKDFVINNFLKHLEGHGMATYKITNVIFNAFSSIKNLQSLLVQSWIYDDYDFSFTPINISKSYNAFSCYIKSNNKKNIFWIGLFEDDNNLYFELVDKNIKKNLIKDNYNFIDDWAFDIFNLENIIGLPDFDSQKIILNQYFRKMMKKLEKYIKAKNGA